MNLVAIHFILSISFKVGGILISGEGEDEGRDLTELAGTIRA